MSGSRIRITTTTTTNTIPATSRTHPNNNHKNNPENRNNIRHRLHLERQYTAGENQRTRQRRRLEQVLQQERELAQQLQTLQTERTSLETELEQLDHELDHVETELALLDEDQQQQQWNHRNAGSATVAAVPSPDEDQTSTTPELQEAASGDDETTNGITKNNAWNEDMEDDEIEPVDDDEDDVDRGHSGWGTLKLTTTTTVAAHSNHQNHPPKPKTIQEFFQRKLPPSVPTAAVVPLPHHAARQQQQHNPTIQNNNNLVPGSQPHQQQLIENLLRNTFRIPNFRDHQQDIIHATLQGQDVFVIMRTGGGKSLTYQLPALLEGRHSASHKVTLVISPLLSLIQDQVEQMNELCPGSALSFTSSIGATEHARRWALVRDVHQGVCLVFVTPEKVSKSNKLCAELDRLFQQGRLGRFVIDEAHCACQWGHDFRPDYAQLGKLKSHFPSIPCIAVTATASDRVRQDVCEILRLQNNYTFFRSTAHRPNLTYTVVPKPSTAAAVVEDMAEFIHQKYPGAVAGIVYTGTKREANSVAEALCEHGIVARAYHADVSPSQKEMIHRSWMRNETQVVVATIAFGLGINKPDVRFVLHHSISKTLEAYYQESGRAGRDGNPAECVLYYSPKDVIRMHKMVHGTSSEHLLWPMIRYGQESGPDAVCKAIMLTHLGEPNAPDVLRLRKEHEGETTILRDVGQHAQTVVRLLEERLAESKAMTMAMLVKDWRSTLDTAPQYVRENSPAKDGLSVDACERIIISLMLENVLAPDPVWNAYDTVIYFVLGPKGRAILQADKPSFIIGFPKVEARKASAKATGQPRKSRQAIPEDGDEWLSAKPKAKRKKATARSKGARKTKKPSAKRKKTTQTQAARKAPAKKTTTRATTKASGVAEVIDLLSDGGDSDASSVDVALVSLKRAGSTETVEESLWDDDESDEEYEFE